MDCVRLLSLAHEQPGSHLLVEAMMGLFDGAADGSASPATLAKQLGIPVVLVVDVAKQSHSIAALVRGFSDHDPDIQIAGVILNKVGSPRHEKMLRDALSKINMSVLGVMPRDEKLVLPERHLGLVQAGEIEGIEVFIEAAAELVTQHCDLQAIRESFSVLAQTDEEAQPIPLLGQHIAIARDEVFAFSYPHMIADWHNQGSKITFFSPLANEAPDQNADAIFLPGGYPELHLEKLAEADRFKASMRSARDKGTLIYGECGGYMVLGESIVAKDGKPYEMCGLLKLQTSFEKRKLHLGYRTLMAKDFVLGDHLMGHEFHYTSAIREEGEPLFEMRDVLGEDLGRQGLCDGNVMGSYAHVIDGARHG